MTFLLNLLQSLGAITVSLELSSSKGVCMHMCVYMYVCMDIDR